jgi:hypothetical protein
MAAKDHRLDIYVDSATYLALRRRAELVDRTVSQHVRHLIRRDLDSFCSEEIARENGQRAGKEHAEDE